MKVYTKTGDKGTTSLFSGKRIPKSSPYLEAYGSVDELNSFLGVALQFVSRADDRYFVFLSKLQHYLFNVGSDLASPLDAKLKISRVTEGSIKEIEQEIDYMEEKLAPIKNFILPGGSLGSSHLHVCRTVCRRAERNCVLLQETETINQATIVFLNRLSDYFFVASRYDNFLENQTDVHWDNSLIAEDSFS